jgi:glycosidase
MWRSSRRQVLKWAGVAGVLLAWPPLLRTKAAAASGPTGLWKDQVVMTVELSKYASAEPNGNLGGNNSSNSNDIQRFQFALDETANQRKYSGFGMLGGDLIGFRNNVTHLKQLGVTSVIVYPVMKSDVQDFFGNLSTGYANTDWKVIDVNFRGAGQPESDFSAFANLVNDLRNPQVGGYKVNVLQDLSMSLAGLEHPWFTPIAAAANIDRFRRWDPNVLTNNSGSDGSGPTTFQDAVFADVSSTFNVDAFSFVDRQTDGNFDGQGNTYPAEEAGYSIFGPMGYGNYIGYVLGLKLNGDMNATAGSSTRDTSFTVPAFKYCTLGVAAAAVGAPRTVTFRVSYSDGSHDDTVVTVPQWDPATAPSQYLYQFPDRHTPSGTVSAPVYVYQVTPQVDPTKVASSVTLRAGSAAAGVRVLGVTGFPVATPVRLDLGGSYDEDGISSDANKGDGNLNGSGLLFPIEPMTLTGRTLTPSIVGTFAKQPTTARFAVGPMFDGRSNMVRALGQAISVPQQRCHLFRLAAFATGSQDPPPATFSVNYTDGTSTTTSLSVKLLTDTSTSSDVVVHQADHAHRFNGAAWIDDSTVQPIVWGYELQADWTKVVTSITLPNNPNLHVVAIDPLVLLDSGFGLPIMDHTQGMSSNTGMYSYALSVLSFWLGQVDFDGYRVDSVQKYYPSFFTNMIANFWNAKFPGKWLFGEAAVAEPTREHPNDQPLPWQLPRQQYTNPSGGVGLTGVYDFNAADAIRNTFGLQDSAISGSFSLVQQSLTWDGLFEQPWNQVAFFDVYENFPFLDYASGSTYADKLPKLRLAAAYLFALNRVPLLFSGNEYLLEYGAGAPVGTDVRKPGYLFSSSLTGDPSWPTYLDNNRFVTALIQMRLNNPALRSQEKLDSTKWFIQGDSLFGFVRQQAQQPTVVAIFNNSATAASSFSAPLPSGLTGSGTFNFVLKNADGSYGGNDSTVSWPSSHTIGVSGMQPWEAKIIRI